MSNDDLLLKKRYYNKVKYDNFLHSMRLEGSDVSGLPDLGSLSESEVAILLRETLGRHGATHQGGAS